MKSKEELRIVFMGTPEFAVESLKALVEKQFQIVGVITMPDKPAGRGHKITYSPVKKYALSKDLNILQPKHLKDEGFLSELRSLNADLQVVVAFRMLPEVVWDMPEYGTFNLHASLLPQYRGAAPINWAIINGEKQTGATTFFLTHEIDTGKIILQRELMIHEEDNAGNVHDKLMTLGADMVVDTVNMILEDKINPLSQNELIDNVGELKPAPKLFNDNTELKFEMTVEGAHNFVRGLSPYPAAWADLLFPSVEKFIRTKIYKTSIEKTLHTLPLGSVVTDKKTAKIALEDGFLSLEVIKVPGKRKMNIVDFLNGLR